MYPVKKIGIFISHIFGSYQSRLCQGVIDKAAEYGCTVELFISSDGEDLGRYALGEAGLLRIPGYEEFSGILFASGTYLLSSLREQIGDTLCEKCRCPILEITQNAPRFACLALDNNHAIAQLTEHMIVTHRKKRICYLGSSAEPETSALREQLYRETMEKHSLPLMERAVYSCGYEDAQIAQALDYFTADGILPECILCYNDRMAVSLCSELSLRGYSVPDDTAVTGFDNLEEGQHLTPALTSVDFPIYELGQTAMELLFHAQHGHPLPASTVLQAGPVYRRSCGCTGRSGAVRTDGKTEPDTLHEKALLSRIYTLEHSILNTIKMSSGIYHIADLESGMDYLETFLPDRESLKELYLCLYPDWNRLPEHLTMLTGESSVDSDADILQMAFAWKDNRRMPGCSFTAKNTLPDYVYSDPGTAYLYVPLFFEEREFGYAVLAYQDNRLCCRFDFLSWLMSVNYLLYSLYTARQTQLLSSKLSDIWQKDSLSGLYNRQGFCAAVPPLLQRADAQKQNALLMTASLSSYHTISESYGFEEADFAVQVLGHAIAQSIGGDVTAAHIHSGCFYLLATDRSADEAQDIIDHIRQYLDHYNKLHTRPCAITAECSFRLSPAGQVQDFMQQFAMLAEQKS